MYVMYVFTIQCNVCGYNANAYAYATLRMQMQIASMHACSTYICTETHSPDEAATRQARQGKARQRPVQMFTHLIQLIWQVAIHDKAVSSHTGSHKGYVIGYMKG